MANLHLRLADILLRHVLHVCSGPSSPGRCVYLQTPGGRAGSSSSKVDDGVRSGLPLSTVSHHVLILVSASSLVWTFCVHCRGSASGARGRRGGSGMSSDSARSSSTPARSAFARARRPRRGSITQSTERSNGTWIEVGLALRSAQRSLRPAGYAGRRGEESKRDTSCRRRPPSIDVALSTYAQGVDADIQSSAR